MQTHMPEHPVMQAILSGDREAFLERESRDAGRRACCRPSAGSPRSSSRRATRSLRNAFAREVVHGRAAVRTIEVLGPAEAPIAVVRGRHRWRLLVKAPRELDLQSYLRAWSAGCPRSRATCASPSTSIPTASSDNPVFSRIGPSASMRPVVNRTPMQLPV